MPASVLNARKLWRNIEFLRWFIFSAVSIIGIAGDLLTKYLTYEIRTVEVIPGILRFNFVINKGIIWGISSQGSILFLIIPAFAIPLIIVIFKYIHIFSGHSDHAEAGLEATHKPPQPARLNLLITIAFGLIMAGAVGNLYDRVLYKGVRDFIDFYFINWPIFNLADVYITFGVILIIVDVFWKPRAIIIQPDNPSADRAISVYTEQSECVQEEPVIIETPGNESIPTEPGTDGTKSADDLDITSTPEKE